MLQVLIEPCSSNQPTYLLVGCPSVPAMQQGAGTFHGGCRVTTDMSGKCAMLPHACRCLNPSACLGGTASANTSLFISDYKTAQCSHPYQGNLCGECLLNSTACLSISGSLIRLSCMLHRRIRVLPTRASLQAACIGGRFMAVPCGVSLQLHRYLLPLACAGDCQDNYGKSRAFLCRKCMPKAAIIMLYIVAALAMIGLIKLLMYLESPSTTVRDSLQQPLQTVDTPR